MDAATARARLERMTAASYHPKLDAAEVAELVVIAARADAVGHAPDHADWTPTYDLNAAAAEGWRWKAAKVAGNYDFGADGASFSRAQVAKECREQVALYAKRARSAGIQTLQATTGYDPGILPVANL